MPRPHREFGCACRRRLTTYVQSRLLIRVPCRAASGWSPLPSLDKTQAQRSVQRQEEVGPLPRPPTGVFSPWGGPPAPEGRRRGGEKGREGGEQGTSGAGACLAQKSTTTTTTMKRRGPKPSRPVSGHRPRHRLIDLVHWHTLLDPSCAWQAHSAWPSINVFSGFCTTRKSSPCSPVKVAPHA